MSEKANQYDPRRDPDLEKYASSVGTWNLERIPQMTRQNFDEMAEKVETSFPEEERKQVEGLNAENRQDLVDVRDDLEERLERDSDINDKLDALIETMREHASDDVRAKLRQALYEAEVNDYVNHTFPSPENEGEEDTNATARENARKLLLMPRDNFNEVTGKWNDLDVVQQARESLDAEEDEAFNMNEAQDKETEGPLLQEGRTFTDVGGKEYYIVSVEKDAGGNPKNVNINVKPFSGAGRTKAMRMPAKDAEELLSRITGQAGEEGARDDHEGTSEGAASGESTESIVDNLDEEIEELRHTDREQAEAARIAAEMEEELRQLEERFQVREMPENLRDHLDSLREQVRELEREIADAIERARAAREGTDGEGGGQGTGTEGTGSSGEGSPDEGEGGPEEETQPMRLRDRLKLAVTHLMTPGSSFRQRVSDAADALTDRGNRGQETGERNRRRRVVKWAMGATAVVLAGGVVWAAIANREDIGQTLHDYFSGETGGNSGKTPNPQELHNAGVDAGSGPELPEFSDAARTAREGEGWLETIGQTTGIHNGDQLRTILTDVGPDLVSRGEAYVAPELGGYGISRPGQLSQRALELIQQSAERHGYTTR